MELDLHKLFNRIKLESARAISYWSTRNLLRKHQLTPQSHWTLKIKLLFFVLWSCHQKAYILMQLSKHWDSMMKWHSGWSLESWHWGFSFYRYLSEVKADLYSGKNPFSSIWIGLNRNVNCPFIVLLLLISLGVVKEHKTTSLSPLSHIPNSLRLARHLVWLDISSRSDEGVGPLASLNYIAGFAS